MNQIISVRSAALTYQARNGEVEALRSVSFDMAEGEFVSICLLYTSDAADD